MYDHAPFDYQCPFCKVAIGTEDDSLATKQSDVFYRDEYITSFISSHWWPNNKGHVLIIPNEHIENIYTLSDEMSSRIHAFEKRVSLALKEIYKCDGVSSRQHNEPAGNQDVWHYHLHVFPRFGNDNLYLLLDQKRATTPEDRLPFATKLKTYFEQA